MVTDKYISIVIACYRDEGSIHEMMKRITVTMDKITPNWEVIYVNDHSPDNAKKVLVELAKQNPRLTVVSHARNFGAQVAFTTGLLQASGDAVVIMDGDLQDPPELIEDFVRVWLSGYDVVYGIRAKRHEGIVRNVGYKIFYRIFKKIAYIPIPLDAGEFSLMDRCVVDVITACSERDRLIRGLRAYAGFKQIGIEYMRPKRFAGESTQSFLSYLGWVYKSFASFSFVPLRFISFLAFCAVMILVLLIGFYFIAYFLGGGSYVPKGYMTLLILILGLGALQLFSISIIGEYVARLFIEVKNRPQPVLDILINDHRSVPRQWLGRTRNASHTHEVAAVNSSPDVGSRPT